MWVAEGGRVSTGVRREAVHGFEEGLTTGGREVEREFNVGWEGLVFSNVTTGGREVERDFDVGWEGLVLASVSIEGL
jgi:hypothetical protein